MAHKLVITSRRNLRSREELDNIHGIHACRAYFGCGNGGRDFDELNMTEAYHALSDSEREELKFGVVDPEVEPESEGPVYRGRSPLNSFQKRAKRERYKANKKKRGM